MTTIEKFIMNELNDSYRFITVYLKNNKKYTTGDHKNYTLEQIKLDKGNKNNFTHYSLAIKLNNIVCIDVDEIDFDYNKLPKFFNSLPYTLGNTKGRHYYCKIVDKPEWIGTDNKVFNLFEGDLIGLQPSSNNIWEKKNGIVYNYNGSLPTISFNDIRPILIPQKQYINIPIEKKSNDIIYHIIDGLKLSRSTEFVMWMNVGYILHNEKYPIDVFDYFSKKNIEKYPGYNQVFDFYSKLTTKSDIDKKLTLNTLWSYLKEDNIKVYNKLVAMTKKAEEQEKLVEEKKKLVEEKNKEKQKLAEEKIIKLENEKKSALQKILEEEQKYNELINNISITITKNEMFNYNTLLKYIDEDVDYLKEYYYKAFEKSKSFLYFNHFHVWHNKLLAIFLVNPHCPPDLYEKGSLYPNLFVNYMINNKPNKILFSKLWLTSKTRNTTDEFIFNPDPNYVNNTNNINLFTGFEFDSDEHYDYDNNIVEPYINHIKHLCRNEVATYDYILNWLSWIFQNPHKKTTVALLIYSRTQGVGKNIAFDIIQKLLKKYYLKVSNTSNLVDKFNSYQQNKILAVCDEINARTRDIADELKDIITRNELKIEYKGKNSYFINDYCNYIFTTNNENVIKIDNTDRRMMIIHTPEVKLPLDKVNILVNLLNDNNKLKHVFNYFMTRDISSFIPQQIVTTKYKKTLILNDLPAYIRMFKLNPQDFVCNDFTATELYKKSLDFAKTHCLSKSYTDQNCFKALKQLLSPYYIRTNKNIIYSFPDDFEDQVLDLINNYINK